MFGKKDKKQKPKVARRKTAASAGPVRNEEPLSFYVALDNELDGDLKGNINVLVAGRFMGMIDVSGLVWIARTGEVDGTIKCDDFRLEGTVKGIVIAKNVADIIDDHNSQAEVSADRTWKDGAFPPPPPPTDLADGKTQE
ncbi:polymer-forming cytoskeletal protein [bacterium]|nr:polymer-forming cytoskeletal protein [bacterium]